MQKNKNKNKQKTAHWEKCYFVFDFTYITHIIVYNHQILCKCIISYQKGIVLPSSLFWHDKPLIAYESVRMRWINISKWDNSYYFLWSKNLAIWLVSYLVCHVKIGMKAARCPFPLRILSEFFPLVSESFQYVSEFNIFQLELQVSQSLFNVFRCFQPGNAKSLWQTYIFEINYHKIGG
jgi:hypothetical protein